EEEFYRLKGSPTDGRIDLLDAVKQMCELRVQGPALEVVRQFSDDEITERQQADILRLRNECQQRIGQIQDEARRQEATQRLNAALDACQQGQNDQGHAQLLALRKELG